MQVLIKTQNVYCSRHQCYRLLIPSIAVLAFLFFLQTRKFEGEIIIKFAGLASVLMQIVPM